MTVSAVAAFLLSVQTNKAVRCPGSLYAVRDDLPFRPFAAIESQAAVVDKFGKVVAVVYLSNANTNIPWVYIVRFANMNQTDARAMHLKQMRRYEPQSPMQRLRYGVPASLHLRKC